MIDLYYFYCAEAAKKSATIGVDGNSYCSGTCDQWTSNDMRILFTPAKFDTQEVHVSPYMECH